MAWFDGNNSFDPSNFDYSAQKDQLDYRKALAAKLQGAQVPQSQMVSGWYVPGATKGAMFGTILQNALGGYMQHKSNQDQKDLNANALKAMAYQLDNQPQAGYTYKDPASVGPQQGGQGDLGPAFAQYLAQGPGGSPDSGAGVTSTPIQPTQMPQQVPMPQPGQGAAPMTGGGGNFGGTGATGSWGNAPQQPVMAPNTSNFASNPAGAAFGGAHVGRHVGGTQSTSPAMNQDMQAALAAELARRQALAQGGTAPSATFPGQPGLNPAVAPQIAPTSVPVAPPALGPAPAAPQAPVAPAPAPVATAPTAPNAASINDSFNVKQPTLGDTLKWAGQLAQTGPMGASIAQNMIAKQFPNYKVELDKDNGKVIMIDQNNPSNIRTMSYTGTEGVPTKSDLEKLKLIADTNQTRTNTTSGLAKAQGETLASGQKAQSNIATFDKAIADQQRMAELSAKVGSRYPLVGSVQQLFSNYGKSDPDVQELNQLFAGNTIEAARAALNGAGRLGQNEYKAFQEATPSMTTNPKAIANLTARQVQMLQQQRAIESAILGEHKRIYGNLGGDTSVFGTPAAPAMPDGSQNMPGAGTAPGYKQRVTTPYSVGQ